jgi:hypothetical protein
VLGPLFGEWSLTLMLCTRSVYGEAHVVRYLCCQHTAATCPARMLDSTSGCSQPTQSALFTHRLYFTVTYTFA